MDLHSRNLGLKPGLFDCYGLVLSYYFSTFNLKLLFPDAMTFGGHRPPSLEPKYEVTVKDKMLYHAITVQPAYENYSFEELRYASPALQRQSETMLVSWIALLWTVNQENLFFSD